jgi:thymidylate synthase
MLIEESNLNELFHTAIVELVMKGKEVKVKANATLELQPCMLTLTNAKRRTLIYPHRGNNPFSTLFETMWILSGSNTIKDLKFFLPRAGDFSDDAHTWRAGYGRRIFNHLGIDCTRASGMVHDSAKSAEWETVPNRPVDQFKYVYETLKADHSSRQAVITIWDPAKECTVGKSKDFPCSNHIAFVIRDGALNCTVTMRSNDVLWGFSSINVYEFTAMQEIIAGMLGVPVGKYVHIANSFHCYTQGGFNAEANFKKLKRCMEYAPDSFPKLPSEPFPVARGRTYEATMEIYRFIHENTCRMINVGKHQFNREVQARENECMLMEPLEVYLYLYVLWKRQDLLEDGDFHDIYRFHMSRLPLTDLKLSCHYWFMKQWKQIKTTEVDKALADVRLYNRGT